MTKKVVVSMPTKEDGFYGTKTPRVFDLVGYSYLMNFPVEWDLCYIADMWEIKGIGARLWDDDRDRLMTHTEISDFD
jgi:hypothetical protein